MSLCQEGKFRRFGIAKKSGEKGGAGKKRRNIRGGTGKSPNLELETDKIEKVWGETEDSATS